MTQSKSATPPIASQHQRFFSWWKQLPPYSLVVILYVLVLLFTDAFFMGDTVWYALQIQRMMLWESGHLLWRPLGYALWQLLNPLTRQSVGDDALNNIVFTLTLINWITGVVAVGSLYGLLRRLSDNIWQICGVTIGFLCAQGFLNYTQSGSSYSTGLAFLVLGLYGLARGAESYHVKWALAGGLALAIAVGMWLPLIFAVPGALFFPLLLFRRERDHVKLVLLSGITFVVVIIALYAITLGMAGITSLPALKEWFQEASHNKTTGGLPRAVFGFARSFISMGDQGVIFKRYVLKDIYNPISWSDLLNEGLLKFALFYLFLLAVVIPLVRARSQWKTLGFVLISSIPVLAFAIYWQGGDMERYLALYPALFIGVICALRVLPTRSVFSYIIWGFLVVATVTNLSALSKIALQQQQTAILERLDTVLPALRPQSTVVTINQQDDVWQFNHSNPFHPLFRQNGEFVYALPTTNWYQRFSAVALKTWRNGGDVWISTRVLHDRPQADWYWVEGEKENVRRSWKGMYTFFQQFEYGPQPSNPDGFVLLLQSDHNQQVLQSAMQEP